MIGIENRAFDYAQQVSELCRHPDKSPAVRIFVQTVVRDETIDRSGKEKRYMVSCFHCRKTMEKSQRFLNEPEPGTRNISSFYPAIKRELYPILEEDEGEEDDDLPALEEK